MSLIYNSLKQHEKKSDSQPKMNPISQRMQALEEPSFSKTFFWLLVSGAVLAIILGLFILQNYWGYQAKDEYENSVNHLVLASKPQESVVATEEPLSVQTESVTLIEIEDENAINGVVINDAKATNLVATVDKKLTIQKPDVAPVPEEHNEHKAKPHSEKLPVLESLKQQNIKAQAEVTEENSITTSSVKSDETVQAHLILEVDRPPETNLDAEKKTAQLTVIQPLEETSVVKKVRQEVTQKEDQTIEKESAIAVKQAQIVEVKPRSVVATNLVKTPRPVVNKTTERTVDSKSVDAPLLANKNTIEYFMAVKTKVAEIKQSIRFNSEKEVQANLNELGQLSGKESVIYQRMDGYASLKNQRYQEAANSYQKLLNQKPEDMEANMNLVIALAELGDQKSAKQQLNRLDSLYPESSQLKHYKKMIHAKYGY